MREPGTIAIACQGGGSHCAFGAGVLSEILLRVDAHGHLTRAGETCRISGLSGTSGGAVNALLAWSGLVDPAGPGRGVEALLGFWHEMAARDPLDAAANATLVSMTRLQGVVPMLDMAPDARSDWGQARLRSLIERHVRFAEIERWVSDRSPDLFIGAANVVSGAFTAFGGHGRHALVSVEHILASAAVPELFHPVKIGGDYYWDGLLSQNPPLRNFLRRRARERIPDEIWIIRINPVEHQRVPTTLADIRDRRNEMAGNLALEEEKYFIRQVNNWVSEGLLPGKKHVALHEIALEEKGRVDDGLDYASKLDRSPAFIERLIELGRSAARRFLGPHA